MSLGDLPMSDRQEEIFVCAECGQEYDQTEEGLTCRECLDAETDAIESRMEYLQDREEYRHDR